MYVSEAYVPVTQELLEKTGMQYADFLLHYKYWKTKLLRGVRLKMKKIGFLVCLILISAFLPAVSAEIDTGEVVVKLQLGNSEMEVNGVLAAIDDSGTAPISVSGRTLVPIRAIIEAFGGGVSWNDSSKTAALTFSGDEVKLVIGKTEAYFNGEPHALDAAPEIIGGRTMLPIRFVAESFNFAVAWDGNTKTVWIIRDSFTGDEYKRLKEELREYGGSPYSEINGNKPYFKDYEKIAASFEYYETLDELGRCGVAEASAAVDLMPSEKRGDISKIKPTGWKNAKYGIVPGGYVYNRCHLLGFQLTGENANARNLITGTRYLNVDGMLPFENKVAGYIKNTGNHVMYRVTPVFDGENLLSSGVLMEALSVEDGGNGLSFCVFCYNVQPGINFDYATGGNALN